MQIPQVSHTDKVEDVSVRRKDSRGVVDSVHRWGCRRASVDAAASSRCPRDAKQMCDRTDHRDCNQYRFPGMRGGTPGADGEESGDISGRATAAVRRQCHLHLGCNKHVYPHATDPLPKFGGVDETMMMMMTCRLCRFPKCNPSRREE